MSGATDRPPLWQLHIRPLFRRIDREHMRRMIDLWDYEQVKARAEHILHALESSASPMPTSSTGGPWPAEWIALFRRWTETGFRRLALGTPIGAYELAQSFEGWELSALARLPSPEAQVWLSPDADDGATRSYVLYLQEAGDSQAAGERPVSDIFQREQLERVVVRDSRGEHTLHFSS